MLTVKLAFLVLFFSVLIFVAVKVFYFTLQCSFTNADFEKRVFTCGFAYALNACKIKEFWPHSLQLAEMYSSGMLW